MPRHTRRITPQKLIKEHRNDRRYRTETVNDDDLELQSYGSNRYAMLMCPVPRRDRRFAGAVGWLEINSYLRSMFTVKAAQCTHQYDYYHEQDESFISPLEDVIDYFDIASHWRTLTLDPNDSMWYLSRDRPPESSAYYTRPDWPATADIETRDPTDVHDDQAGFDAFAGATQEEVNPDAIPADHPALKDLPAFIDAGERDDCLGIYHPEKNSEKIECDHCGGEHPWYRPMERGVRALRPGGIDDGNSDFGCCDPVLDDVRSCEECGCPRCNALGISFRKTMSPSYRCQTCGLEFEHRVDRQADDDAKRARLFWTCRHCQRPTRAPFAGIPEELLDAA